MAMDSREVLRIVKEVKEIYNNCFSKTYISGRGTGHSQFRLDGVLRTPLSYVDRKFPELLEEHENTVFDSLAMGLSFEVTPEFDSYLPPVQVIKSGKLYLIGYPNDTSKWEKGMKYSYPADITLRRWKREYNVDDYRGGIGGNIYNLDKKYKDAVSKDIELFLRGVKPTFLTGSSNAAWETSYNSVAVKTLGTSIISKYIVVAYIREKDGKIFMLPSSYGKKSAFVAVDSIEQLRSFLDKDYNSRGTNYALLYLMDSDPMCTLESTLPPGDFVYYITWGRLGATRRTE